MAWQVLRGILLLLLCGLSVNALAAITDWHEVPTAAGTWRIDRATLAIELMPPTGSTLPLAAPAFSGANTTPLTAERWQIQQGRQRFDIAVTRDQNDLQVSIRAAQPATLDWPISAQPSAIDAYAFPFGEGNFVPSTDPGWLDWLVRRYQNESTAGALSMPFWTELRKKHSLTWMVETPLNTEFSIVDTGGRPQMRLRHAFTRLAPDAPYIVRLHIAGPDVMAGARRYRDWLQQTGQFVSLDEKIKTLPATARLGGAAHIYLWDSGLLKAADIADWPGFLQRLQAGRQVSGSLAARVWQLFDTQTRDLFEAAFNESVNGSLSTWRRQTLIHALNSGLRLTVPRMPVAPLPGKHDPMAEVAWGRTVREQLLETFGETLQPPAQWGDGLSTSTIDALRTAGLQRAWLGADNWLSSFWRPEAVGAAKAAGYLVGVYDSYGSAHREDLANTWPTAQMGNALAGAGYRDQDGKLAVGFAGRGVYANPQVVEPYAQRRISAVAGAGQLNSYFLDVDGAGPMLEDYTPGREMNQADDAQAHRRRLEYPALTHGLVTGSEGVLSMFAAQVAFAHGVLTPPFAWMDPAIQDPRSPYYRGRYWPPEAPSLYFQPVPLADSVARYVTRPQFRLPLYEIALHDSIVSTHHWEYGSLKFTTERDQTALLQLLYMVPPLYHLSDPVLRRDLPLIQAYDRVFSPLHQRLFTQAMTHFETLSRDRLVQRSQFADGTRVTVNFDRQPRTQDKKILPALSATVQSPGGSVEVLEMEKIWPPVDQRPQSAGQ